jgi:NhaP-type Na+/H+ or K+/H+ antiporter
MVLRPVHIQPEQLLPRKKRDQLPVGFLVAAIGILGIVHLVGALSILNAVNDSEFRHIGMIVLFTSFFVSMTLAAFVFMLLRWMHKQT